MYLKLMKTLLIVFIVIYNIFFKSKSFWPQTFEW